MEVEREKEKKKRRLSWRWLLLEAEEESLQLLADAWLGPNAEGPRADERPARTAVLLLGSSLSLHGRLTARKVSPLSEGTEEDVEVGETRGDLLPLERVVELNCCLQMISSLTRLRRKANLRPRVRNYEEKRIWAPLPQCRTPLPPSGWH
jgi:hypothetical protein